jgi:hypothetical protein
MAVPFFFIEKLNAPGRLSKYGLAGETIVSRTGMVTPMVAPEDVTTICPVYVPTASEGLGLTDAIIACGTV